MTFALSPSAKAYMYSMKISSLANLSRIAESEPATFGHEMHTTSVSITAKSALRRISTDFGILRLIVSEVDKAVEILRNADFAVMLTDVVCISCPNVAGSLSAILEKLASEEIFIEYMYAFADGDKANVVIRPNEIEKCLSVLGSCACELRKF